MTKITDDLMISLRVRQDVGGNDHTLSLGCPLIDFRRPDVAEQPFHDGAATVAGRGQNLHGLSAALCGASDAASFAIDASTVLFSCVSFRRGGLEGQYSRAAASSVAMSASIH